MTGLGLRAASLAAALFISSLAGAAPPGAPPSAKLCEREMLRASKAHGVPLSMLYAVGLTETGRAGSLQPYALNIEGKAAYGIGLDEALRLFEEARRKGVKLIDLGCMQINHHFHKEHFASVREMFDPARNVDYAARFLKELYKREGTWTLAVARYNAGPNNNPAQKRYVCRVIKNMVATGFGEWTDNARRFCES
ncbi:MAG: lytic transglycosylase domain-containing protein [Rhodomicrobium sp.]|nr:lytic transglycosylase domain-containing protein [Rhodomicrobium sp.]